MGLTVSIEDERGKRLELLEDPQGALARILPSPDDQRFQLLRFVDRYQDTVFNQLQAPVLIQDLELIITSVSEREARELLARVLELSRKVASQPHTYLKFYGD